MLKRDSFGNDISGFELRNYKTSVDFLRNLPQVFNDHGSVLSRNQNEFSQNITIIDHWQNRSIANPNCEKIRLRMMNLTVPNGSRVGGDSNDGDDHANFNQM